MFDKDCNGGSISFVSGAETVARLTSLFTAESFALASELWVSAMVVEPLVAAGGFPCEVEPKVGMLRPETFGRLPSCGGASLIAMTMRKGIALKDRWSLRKDRCPYLKECCLEEGDEVEALGRRWSRVCLGGKGEKTDVEATSNKISVRVAAMTLICRHKKHVPPIGDFSFREPLIC